MQQHTTIPFLHPPLTAEGSLTEVLHQGAQRLLAQEIKAEVAMFLARYADRREAQGQYAVVQNGSLPEREVQTGIGAVRVKVTRVRDRHRAGIRFHSSLSPSVTTGTPTMVGPEIVNVGLLDCQPLLNLP
jgi:hypothetical protein